jgi:hypothetical protein
MTKRPNEAILLDFLVYRRVVRKPYIQMLNVLDQATLMLHLIVIDNGQFKPQNAGAGRRARMRDVLRTVLLSLASSASQSLG